MKTSFGSAALVGLALSSAMAFYAVSLHVAAERAGIDKVRAQIVADSHDIRMLQAELRTRARLPELQRWNEQVLALAPPKPNQFIDSPLVLANYTPPSSATPRAADPVRFAAVHPSVAPASPVQQVAFQRPVAGVGPMERTVAAQTVPTKKPVPAASVAAAADVSLVTAAPKAPAHHAPKPLVVAAAGPATPPSIGLDATLGGQLAAAAAQEHVTRASYTLR